MGCYGVSGKCGNGMLVFVYDSIYYKGQPCHSGCGFHVLMYRVILQHACGGAGVVYKAAAMITQHSKPAAYPRQHALSSPGKACKKVRFYKTLGYKQIGFRSYAVHIQGRAGRQLPQIYHVSLIVAVVYRYPLSAKYTVAQLVAKLVGGGLPVQASGHKQSYFNIRITLPQFREHYRQYVPAWHRPCMIGYYDRACPFSL